MTRDDMIKHFGDNLESERMKLGFSQTQMAEALDMSLSTYKRLLTGETAKIDFYTLYRLYQLTNTLGINLGDEQNPYMDVFYRLHQLSDSQFRMIRSMVDFELAFSEGLAPDERESDYITVLVPPATGRMAWSTIPAIPRRSTSLLIASATVTSLISASVSPAITCIRSTTVATSFLSVSKSYVTGTSEFSLTNPPVLPMSENFIREILAVWSPSTATVRPSMWTAMTAVIWTVGLNSAMS